MSSSVVIIRAIYVTIGAVPWLWFVLRDRLGSIGDMVGLGLPVLAVPTIVMLAIGLRWVPGPVVVAWMASWSIVFAIGIFGPRFPTRMDAPVDPITLVTANVRYDNSTPRLAAADLLAQNADVLVVPEASRPIIAALAEHYEYVQRSDEGRAYGVAVFSRLPLKPSELLAIGNGVLHIEVGGSNPFVLYAAHLSRPVLNPQKSTHVSHRENYREVRELKASMRREALPVVVAGDLNLSDRTRGYRALTDGFVDVARSGWGRTTYIGGWYRAFLLRIDHVLVSEQWCGENPKQVTVADSDHHAVRVDIGPCR